MGCSSSGQCSDRTSSTTNLPARRPSPSSFTSTPTTYQSTGHSLPSITAYQLRSMIIDYAPPLNGATTSASHSKQYCQQRRADTACKSLLPLLLLLPFQLDMMIAKICCCAQSREGNVRIFDMISLASSSSPYLSLPACTNIGLRTGYSMHRCIANPWSASHRHYASSTESTAS